MHTNDQVADPSDYGESYYASHCGEEYKRTDEWLAFFGNAAERIINSLHPTTTLDVGCAYGFLVEQLAKRGVAASGIDFSDYAISKVDASVKDTCLVASATDPIDGRYDLITTIEMLEHLSAPDAQRAIKNMAAATDTILVSTTPYDYIEPTHINVQQPEYWTARFAEVGFFRDLSFDASYITPWAVLYRQVPADAPGLVAGYERELFRAHTERDQLRAETKRLWSVIDGMKSDAVQVPSSDPDEIERLTEELWAARDALEGALAARGSAQGQLAVALGEVEAQRLEHEEWEARLYIMHAELTAAQKQIESPAFQVAKARGLASKAKRKLGQ